MKGCHCETCEKVRTYKRERGRAQYNPERAKRIRDKRKAAAAAWHSAKWREMTPEQRADHNEKRRAYYQKNKDREAARAAKWRRENPEKHIATWKRSHAKTRLRYATWAIRNPEAYLSKRYGSKWRPAVRYRKHGSYGYELSDVAPMRDGAPCSVCGEPMFIQDKVRKLKPTLDHVKPISIGGAHEPENLAWAHWRCNCAKGKTDGSRGLPFCISIRCASIVRHLRAVANG